MTFTNLCDATAYAINLSKERANYSYIEEYHSPFNNSQYFVRNAYVPSRSGAKLVAIYDCGELVPL